MLDRFHLKVIRRIHRMRRAVRAGYRGLGRAAYPISDSYSRDALKIEHVIGRVAPLRHDDQRSAPAAIYSTFCGPTYSLTFTGKIQDHGVPRYFVSNNKRVLKIVEAHGWLPIFLDVPISSNPMESAHQAKIAKSVPQIFPDLKQHRYLAYIDDKQDISAGRLSKDFSRLTKADGAIAATLYSHVTDNILLEYTIGMQNERYRLQSHHMARYLWDRLQNGARLHDARLFTTQYIVRDLEHPNHDRLSMQWYEEILACGIHCQLSFDLIALDNPLIVDMPPLKDKGDFLTHGPTS